MFKVPSGISQLQYFFYFKLCKTSQTGHTYCSMSSLQRDYNLYFVSKCTTTENDDLETSSSAPGKEVMDRSLTTCNDSNVSHRRKEKSQNEHCNKTILNKVINENKLSRFLNVLLFGICLGIKSLLILQSQDHMISRAAIDLQVS